MVTAQVVSIFIPVDLTTHCWLNLISSLHYQSKKKPAKANWKWVWDGYNQPTEKCLEHAIFNTLSMNWFVTKIHPHLCSFPMYLYLLLTNHIYDHLYFRQWQFYWKVNMIYTIKSPIYIFIYLFTNHGPSEGMHFTFITIWSYNKIKHILQLCQLEENSTKPDIIGQ